MKNGSCIKSNQVIQNVLNHQQLVPKEGLMGLRPNIYLHIQLFIFPLSLCFSWRSVLRIWAAPQSQWDPPWLSCSPVLHKEMNTTQVGTTDTLSSSKILEPLPRSGGHVIASIHLLFSFQINVSLDSYNFCFEHTQCQQPP